MGTKHIKFEDYPDDAAAGDEEVFTVDINQFDITDDMSINSAAFFSEEGLVVSVATVVPTEDGNYFTVHIPNDTPTGEYQFKMSVFSLRDPSNTAIFETSDFIEIQGASEAKDPPTITSVHFRVHSTTIPAADLTGDTLVINGKNLNYVTSIKIIAPAVLFNITSHSEKVLTAKAISAPRVQGLKVAFVEFEYTVTDEHGEFIESGEVRCNTPLRIQGD